MRWGKFQQSILLVGDAMILYLGLYITLIARYNSMQFEFMWQLHLLPFSIIFLLWLIIFYIAGLYEGIRIGGRIAIIIRIARALSIGGLIAIALFYLIPIFIITPKTNLFFVLTISFSILTLWRILFGNILHYTAKIRVLILGASEEIKELVEFLSNHPQFGYKVVANMRSFDADLKRIIRDRNIEIIVAADELGSNKEFAKIIYEILPQKVSFIAFSSFYEKLLGKIPVSLISETWFLENLSETEKKFFEIGKRGFDIIMSLILGVITLILLPFIAMIIKLESRGPVFLYSKKNRQRKTGI
ncbi:hypothetical protein ACFL3E_02240 [Patescibacteria group bacterium]